MGSLYLQRQGKPQLAQIGVAARVEGDMEEPNIAEIIFEFEWNVEGLTLMC